MANFKDLELEIYIHNECPWCKKTLDLLKDENEIDNVKIIDVVENNIKINGVPYFKSIKYNTDFVGHKNSIHEIM